MDHYCYSQDSFESNFPPLEFLLEEEQKCGLDSENLHNEQNVATSLQEDFVLETPPSKKAIQKHVLEISSPVTLSKIQCQSEEISRCNEGKYFIQKASSTISKKNVSLQTKSTKEHRTQVLLEQNRDSQSIFCRESSLKNITDIDDACSIHAIQEDDLNCKNVSEVEDKDENGEFYDVLQIAAFPGESRKDTVTRIGHEKLWELASNALLKGKKVIGDEIIYGREEWRKEKLTKLQLVELFGCRNGDSYSPSFNRKAHFLGGGDLSVKNKSDKKNWDKVKARHYPTNKYGHFPRKKLSRKKAKN
ncbi:hypothetical protein GpartN1_g5432.t1 [Galdieria partita]|uniref:Uncharacterized protein n=1 Tax=Galdieria partita TaxID=83374 RepID=A0A9C7PZW0_9RHOD|nr:hypothetical protein GpartN1_g5432.t1 [Galdieria partita]